ncbi:MAG: hypothetical protein ACR2HN_12165 [Tepidiformaceae bacterium]
MIATLADLGLTGTGAGLILIAPPDAVLAEAGRLQPRPSIASTLQVAEPAARMAWWPERRFLDPASLSRLRWMLQAGRGEAWLIIDPGEEDGVTVDELREALAGTGLQEHEERELPSGEMALRVS